MKHTEHTNRRRHARLIVGSAALLFAASAAQLSALSFSFGDMKGSFDTTLSLGGLYRLENPDRSLYGTTSAFQGVTGLQNSVNADDGDLNFPKGWASQLVKASHDLEVKYKDAGALVRGYYFYDNKVMNHWKGRTQLSQQAIDRVGKGFEFLDMYAYFHTEAAGMPIDFRFGRQVLSLGESTFIPNGINVVNAVDVSKLRMPGAELKEALLPVNLIKFSIGLTKNLSLEPYYMLEFRRNEIEPNGTYFSTNDLVSKGASKVMLGFGSLPDSGTLGMIPRGPDRDASDTGQGGISLRYLAQELNDTEFGFYYARYHSRSPLVSATTPTTAINPDLTGPLTAVYMQGGLSASAAAAQAAATWGAYYTSLTNPSALTPTQIAILSAPSTAPAIQGAGKIALLTAGATGRYYAAFPEGIDMFGASFNTNLGNTGISWQGEVSVKKNQPLQVDDVELLFAALSSLTQSVPFGANNQLGNYYGKLNTQIDGFRRHTVWTAQSTMTKTFNQVLGANQLLVLGEVGMVQANLPDKSVLRYDAPATFTTGSATSMANTGNAAYPATPESAFASNFSWGYQVVGRLEYNNLFAGVNVIPSIAFTHDVKGNTPLPLGNFVEGRKSITIGAEFNYLNAWSLDLKYVNFSGAKPYNLLGDRDYFAATLKYSF